MVLGDQRFYTKGSYFGYASPWCALKNKSLVVGTDLINKITLWQSTFPSRVNITTVAPTANPWDFGCGVYGYVHIGYGNYDGSIVQSPVTSRRVSEVSKFSTEFDISSYTAAGGEYNVLNEFYLTSAAGANQSKLLEIGFFLHASASAVNFAKTGTALGTFSDADGRRWSVYKAGTFAMVIPNDGKDVTSGTLDIRGVLDFLTAKGIVSGTEWINGVAIGVEPIRGSASMTINKWQVTFG